MKEQQKYIIHSSNNINLQEKVFYLPSDDSFVKKSNNPYTKKKQKEEEKENKNYPFIVRTGKSVNFKEEGRDLENLSFPLPQRDLYFPWRVVTESKRAVILRCPKPSTNQGSTRSCSGRRTIRTRLRRRSTKSAWRISRHFIRTSTSA